MTQADAIRKLAAELSRAFIPLNMAGGTQLAEIAAARFSDEDWDESEKALSILHRYHPKKWLDPKSACDFNVVCLSKEDMAEFRKCFSDGVWGDLFKAAVLVGQPGSCAVFNNTIIYEESTTRQSSDLAL